MEKEQARAKEQVSLIIENGTLLPMTASCPVVENGAVAIDSLGKIVCAGGGEAVRGKYTAASTVNVKGNIILPGFVNTHHHFMQNFLKGASGEESFAQWLDRVSFPRIKKVVAQYKKNDHRLHYYAALHAGIDLLKSGITTSVNMEWALAPDAVEATSLVGLRAIHTLTLADEEKWTPKEALLGEDESFDLANRLLDACTAREDGLASFAYGLACHNSCSEGLIRRTVRESEKTGAPVHIHLCESQDDIHQIQARHQCTIPAWLEGLGLFDRPVWGAHCIWVTEQDIDLLKKHDVGISYNPKCNMKLALGVAPIPRMLEKGLSVGLAIDSCAVSDNTDFFEQMRAGILLQRISAMNPSAVSAKEALWMATMGGAQAVKMGTRVGSLEAGKEADLIVLDIEKATMRPLNNAVNNVVFSAGSQVIDKVFVRGRMLVDKGELIHLDEGEVLREAEAYAQKIFGS